MSKTNAGKAPATAKLVTIQYKTVLNLPSLHYEVLRFIFEKELMKADEVKFMQQSMVRWAQHVEVTQDEDILYMLQQLAKMLVRNEEGKYDYQKATFKALGINWRKAFDIPGAHTAKDYHEGQQHYEKWLRENPEFDTKRKARHE